MLSTFAERVADRRCG